MMRGRTIKGDFMNYWIFKANPAQYRLAERLKDAEKQISWRVTRYKDEIQKGDTFFIWRTGAERGICAVARIDTNPAEMKELESEQKYNVERDIKIIMRVLGTLTHRFDRISPQELKNISGLENLSVFSGFQQATNFRVTDQEGEILMKLAEGR
ncbi:MAG: hypothetical protein C0402_13735 [Thermodesulfovibrio sp.]|nr:hypothetical protein [Thermodesulfovibrio sp.]